ncbi:MAG: tetratricopeptide repeat protein [Ignavibacteriae bacterium]|nr:MAG: tetratricopeptide repeat protein [Ignavibacteriota bacterium]
MKSNLFYLLFAVLLAGLLTLGFQCGSPEFTGAKVQEQNKNYAEAVKLLEKEVQKNPANAEAWFRLGRIRGMQLNDVDGMNQAFQECEKVSKEFSSDITALRGYYWVQFINSGVSNKNRATKDSMQFYDKAVADYLTAAKLRPDTSITYLYIAAAYKGKGDIANEIAYMTKVWEMDHDKEVYKSVGRIYVQQGLDKKEEFRAANAEQLKIQKNLKDVDKGSYKSDVTRILGPADSQKKDKKNPKKEDWIYNQYSLSLTFDGDRVVNRKFDKPFVAKIDSTKYFEAADEFNKAVNIFEAVKAANPKDNENLNLLLQAYYEASRTVEATKAFKQAVVNEPENKMNHYILGLLYRSVDDYDGAIAEFTEAIRLDPQFTDAFYDLGATYYNWGVKIKRAAQEKGEENDEYKAKFHAALPWMEKVTVIKPDDAKIWETLGTIYALLGQTDKATKALDEADKIRKSGK